MWHRKYRLVRHVPVRAIQNVSFVSIHIASTDAISITCTSLHDTYNIGCCNTIRFRTIQNVSLVSTHTSSNSTKLSYIYISNSTILKVSNPSIHALSKDTKSNMHFSSYRSPRCYKYNIYSVQDTNHAKGLYSLLLKALHKKLDG